MLQPALTALAKVVSSASFFTDMHSTFFKGASIGDVVAGGTVGAAFDLRFDPVDTEHLAVLLRDQSGLLKCYAVAHQVTEKLRLLRPTLLSRTHQLQAS